MTSPSSSYPRLRLPLIMAVMVALLLGTGKARAQGDMILTQYWAVPTLYNPSYTGDIDFIRIRGAARMQWVGIENAPKDFLVAADMPFKLFGKRIGAGINISQESIGLFDNLLINAQGSYKFNALKGQFSIGLQVGYYNSKFNGSEVYIPSDDDYHQPNDPAIPTQDLSGKSIDFSLGASYTHKYFYAGVSALHITSPKVNLTLEGNENMDAQEYETELPRAIYFTGGSNIMIKNSLFLLQPSLLVATDFNDFSADITMRATYNKFLTFGLGYRWDDAISIMAGVNYKNFFLGYSFDYPTSDISKVSSGSHEIVAGYQLKLDLSGKNKNKHRSIRIM